MKINNETKGISTIIGGILIFIIVILISISCNKKQKDNINTDNVDTVYVDLGISRDFYIYTIDSLYSINDSLIQENKKLIYINDSINEQLFVALYKLDRVEYYNKIAANGNNIKFLRGWINRVLYGS